MSHLIAELKIPAEVKQDMQIIVNTLLDKFSFNINKIILFGSYATSRYQPDSDIDIAVVLNELPYLKERVQYKQAVDIDRDVDLLFCSKEQLSDNKFVFRRVNEQGVVLYEQL